MPSSSTKPASSWSIVKRIKAENLSKRSRRRPAKTPRLSGYRAIWAISNKSRKSSVAFANARNASIWYVYRVILSLKHHQSRTAHSDFVGSSSSCPLVSTPTNTERPTTATIAISRSTILANSTCATSCTHSSGKLQRCQTRQPLALYLKRQSSTACRPA